MQVELVVCSIISLQLPSELCLLIIDSLSFSWLLHEFTYFLVLHDILVSYHIHFSNLYLFCRLSFQLLSSHCLPWYASGRLVLFPGISVPPTTYSYHRDLLHAVILAYLFACGFVDWIVMRDCLLFILVSPMTIDSLKSNILFNYSSAHNSACFMQELRKY